MEIQKIVLEDGYCIVRVDVGDEVVATQCFPNEWTASNAIQLMKTVVDALSDGDISEDEED